MLDFREPFVHHSLCLILPVFKVFVDELYCVAELCLVCHSRLLPSVARNNARAILLYAASLKRMALFLPCRDLGEANSYQLEDELTRFKELTRPPENKPS